MRRPIAPPRPPRPWIGSRHVRCASRASHRAPGVRRRDSVGARLDCVRVDAPTRFPPSASTPSTEHGLGQPSRATPLRVFVVTTIASLHSRQDVCPLRRSSRGESSPPPLIYIDRRRGNAPPPAGVFDLGLAQFSEGTSLPHGPARIATDV